MIYDDITYQAALDAATILNDNLSVEQAAVLVYVPMVEHTAQKPFYRPKTLCVPVVNTGLFTWPSVADEMGTFSFKCQAAVFAYSDWIEWVKKNKGKTLEQQTAKYSELLEQEISPYL